MARAEIEQEEEQEQEQQHQQHQQHQQEQEPDEEQQEQDKEGSGARTPMLPDSKASFFAMIFSSSVTTARSCSASFAQPSFRTSSSSDAIAVRTPTAGRSESTAQALEPTVVVGNSQQAADIAHGNSQQSTVTAQASASLRSPQPKNMPCGQPSGRSSAL